MQVTVVEEQPDILGTGGGLRAVADRLAERVVVLNGDTLCDVDLTDLLTAMPPGGGAMALRVHPHEARERYGVVAHDEAGRVVDLKGLATAPSEGPVHRDAHFTGVHALHREMLAHVPPGFACIVRTAYIAEVPRRRIAAVRHTGTWLDVGDPAAYLDANLAALEARVALPLDPWARAAGGVRAGRVRVGAGTLTGPVWLGAGARVAGEVRRSVVGAGARVPAGARLRDCVVWDGVVVPPGDWVRHVFLPDGPFPVDEGHITSVGDTP